MRLPLESALVQRVEPLLRGIAGLPALREANIEGAAASRASTLTRPENHSPLASSGDEFRLQFWGNIVVNGVTSDGDIKWAAMLSPISHNGTLGIVSGVGDNITTLIMPSGY
jgi:hypothetical protein